MANPEHVAILKQGVEAWNAWVLTPEGEDGGDLSGVDLRGAELPGIDFDNSSLERADLSGADLCRALFSFANLDGARVCGADLTFAVLQSTSLKGTDLTGATLDGTILVSVDLRRVIGLEQARAFEGVSVGIDTIYQSRGQIPASFLRSCGVPDECIEFFSTLTFGDEDTSPRQPNPPPDSPSPPRHLAAFE